MNEQTKQSIVDSIFIIYLTLIFVLTLVTLGIEVIIIISSVVLIYLLERTNKNLKKFHEQMNINSYINKCKTFA